MKGAHIIWLSISKGMTADIWIRDYNLPRYSRRKSLAGVNIMYRNKHSFQQIKYSLCKEIN
jgi:hypothetical protein